MRLLGVKKLMEQNNRWSYTNNFYKQILTGGFFLLAIADNHAWYKPIFIGCMKRQHAVVLQQIWETDSIFILFPAERSGLLTPLLTCFTLLSFSRLFGQIILSPTPFLPFAFLDKKFLSPFSLPGSLWGKNFLSPN